MGAPRLPPGSGGAQAQGWPLPALALRFVLFLLIDQSINGPTCSFAEPSHRGVGGQGPEAPHSQVSELMGSSRLWGLSFCCVLGGSAPNTVSARSQAGGGRAPGEAWRCWAATGRDPGLARSAGQRWFKDQTPQREGPREQPRRVQSGYLEHRPGPLRCGHPAGTEPIFGGRVTVPVEVAAAWGGSGWARACPGQCHPCPSLARREALGQGQSCALSLWWVEMVVWAEALAPGEPSPVCRLDLRCSEAAAQRAERPLGPPPRRPQANSLPPVRPGGSRCHSLCPPFQLKRVFPALS